MLYAANCKMTTEGLPEQRLCTLLGVSESQYHSRRNRVPSKKHIRHAWFLDQVKPVTHTWWGASAVNTLFAGPGCPGDLGSAVFVFTRLDRRTHPISTFSMGLAGWPRPFLMPARRAAFRILPTLCIR